MSLKTETKRSAFESPLFKTKIKSVNVKAPEAIFGYFIGPFGALLASGIFTAYLNNYWTDVLFAGQKIEGTALGNFLFLLPLLSTVLIVTGNLIVGQLIEKTKTSAGKARPWILLSSVLLGVACILMFTVPLFAGENNVLKMVLTAVSYNLYYSVAYPMYNTANSTLIPVSTRNPSQRGLLASLTNFAHLGVMGAGSMVFPVLAGFILGTNAGAWAVAFIIIGVVSFAFTVLQYYFTRERVSEETVNAPITEKLPLKKQVKACVTDKFWWIILGFYLIFQFAGAIKNLSMVYFCKFVVDNGFWGQGFGGFGLTQTLLGIAGALPMALAMAFIWPLSRKFDKKTVVFGGCILGIVGGVIAGLGYTNPVLVTVGVALKCFGSAPACYMILALISDMLDHMEARNGFRCDGFTMSVYSSIMVASTPVMTAVFNAILSGIGYNADKFQALVESGVGIDAAATTALNVSYIWIETAAFLVCAVVIMFFVVEKYLKIDHETIKARQKAEVEAAGGVWVEAEERLKAEEMQAAEEAERARIDELRSRCEKKGLDFSVEEEKYQRKLAEKNAKKKNKS